MVCCQLEHNLERTFRNTVLVIDHMSTRQSGFIGRKRYSQPLPTKLVFSRQFHIPTTRKQSRLDEDRAKHQPYPN